MMSADQTTKTLSKSKTMIYKKKHETKFNARALQYQVVKRREISSWGFALSAEGEIDLQFMKLISAIKESNGTQKKFRIEYWSSSEITDFKLSLLSKYLKRLPQLTFIYFLSEQEKQLTLKTDLFEAVGT